MSRIGTSLAIAVVMLAFSAAEAEEYPFAIRFGLLLLEPTSESRVGGSTRTFDTQSGAEVAFEWYFLSRLGLEAGVLGSADVDVADNNDEIAALTFTTLTLGLTAHPVRTESVDWGLGVVAGRAVYGDFDWTDGSATFSYRRDTVWGVQTFLDIPIKKGGRWGLDVGVKWISTGLDLESGYEIEYDPFIGRVMGVYRWGRPR